MTSPPLTPFQGEAALLGKLADAPPWATTKSNPRGDTALRATFRRWSPADETPATLMLDAVFRAASSQSWFDLLSQDMQDDAASRVARALHVFSLDADDGRALASFGAACGHRRKPNSGPVITTLRFARLVNPPPSERLRLETLGRAFRRFGSPEVSIRVAGSDAPNVLRFLFDDDPARTVARWAGDYFRTRPPESDEVSAPNGGTIDADSFSTPSA